MMNLPTLERFLSRKNLSVQRKDGLVLFDYNRNVTYEFDWDEVTINARGIVFEEATGKVIARGFRKFWNHSEISSPERLSILPGHYHPNFDGDFMCLEKVDGSCGICYFYNGEWRISTRGSFESEQAVWATQWLRANVKTHLMNPALTYLFEIVYPENKIVVDYGSKEALVLIGIVNTASGMEWFAEELASEAERIGVEMAKVFVFSSLEQVFSARDLLGNNEEGFVVTYRNGYKFKLKGDEYCKLHKAVSNLTPLAFWRMMDPVEGKVSQAFLEMLPEEFRSTTDLLRSVMEEKFLDELTSVENYASGVPTFDGSPEGRKARFMWVSQNVQEEYRGAVMNLLSGSLSKLHSWIHREIRPTSNMVDGLDPRIGRILEEG